MKTTQKKQRISAIARELGKRGGEKTKLRGKEFYKRISKLGVAKRWGKRATGPKDLARKKA